MNFEIKGNLFSFYSYFFLSKYREMEIQRISQLNVSVECEFHLIIIFSFRFFYLLFAGGKTPDLASRTYTQIMREQMLQGEETEVGVIIRDLFS